MTEEHSGDLLFFRRRLLSRKELVVFCRMHGLSTVGTKDELERRIVYFLKTGRRLDPYLDEEPDLSEISMNDRIGENFSLEDRNRDFFREYVGEDFDEEFLEWLKEHPDSTYEDALNKYLNIKKSH